MRNRRNGDTGIDRDWLEASVQQLAGDLSERYGSVIYDLVKAARETLDTLRRVKGGGNLTDDSRLTLIATAMVLETVRESELTKVMPEYEKGLALAASLVATLCGTGQ